MSTQSHTSVASFQNVHQNSHDYVDIDAIDSILSENENFKHFEGTVQGTSYELNPNDSRIQSLLEVGIASPIYENQTSLINRSESPIYSNTHTQSIASLYPKSQNIYSNLPAITAGPSNYANIQPAHHALQPSKLKYFAIRGNFKTIFFQFINNQLMSFHCHLDGLLITHFGIEESITLIIILKLLIGLIRLNAKGCLCSGNG